MNTTSTKPKTNTQIVEEASTWFVEFTEGDGTLAQRTEFNRWLRTSPEHVRAYLQVSALWEDASVIGKHCRTAADELISQALAGSNVVPLGSHQQTDDQARRSESPSTIVRPSSWSRRALLAASALLALVSTGALTWMLVYRTPSYATGVGEQRTLVLSDGSTVELNAQSNIRVRFSENERTVDLVAGQALFHVAKNTARPFVVVADETHVRAVGTQFDVYRRTNGTVVTVVEGRVAVSSDNQRMRRATSVAAPTATSEPLVFLTAGEQVVITAAAIAPPEHANISVATAWTKRQLVFNSTPLTEVVEQYNRYNVRPLVIQDDELADFHISGVFSANDSTSLIDFLRAQPGILVLETDSEIRIAST